MNVGAALKAAREKAGLSQAEASRRSGVHWVHLSRLEGGKVNPTVRTLVRLAEVYGVEVGQMLDTPTP